MFYFQYFIFENDFNKKKIIYNMYRKLVVKYFQHDFVYSLLLLLYLKKFFVVQIIF